MNENLIVGIALSNHSRIVAYLVSILLGVIMTIGIVGSERT